MNNNPPTLIAKSGREFATVPAAVVIFIVNPNEEILLLKSPKRKRWEVISGALEAGETVLAGALREVYEEAGRQIKVRPLGAVHTATFHYDENLPYMFSLCYLFAYEGGQIIPGDDMIGAPYQWVGLDQWGQLSAQMSPRANHFWLAHRTIDLYRIWVRQDVSLWHETEPVR